MICSRCGAEIPDTSKFCTKCGASVAEMQSEASAASSDSVPASVPTDEKNGSEEKKAG